MLPNTMFPTLRIALALNVKIKPEKLHDREHVHVYIGGRLIGHVVNLPFGGPSDVEVAAGYLASFVNAFRDKGYSNPQENLVPEDMRTNDLALQSICRDIRNEQAVLKSMKRRARTHTLWVCKDSKPGEYFSFKSPISYEVKQAVKMANPAQTILFFINDDIVGL